MGGGISIVARGPGLGVGVGVGVGVGSDSSDRRSDGSDGTGAAAGPVGAAGEGWVDDLGGEWSMVVVGL